jgi:hypothetical protein
LTVRERICYVRSQMECTMTHEHIRPALLRRFEPWKRARQEQRDWQTLKDCVEAIDGHDVYLRLSKVAEDTGASLAEVYRMYVAGQIK